MVNRYSYDPWGNRTAATEAVPNPFEYASGYYGSTGLSKFGERY